MRLIDVTENPWNDCDPRVPRFAGDDQRLSRLIAVEMAQSRIIRVFLLLAFAGLAGCAGTAASVWAPDEAVARARYVHEAPPSITLITVVNNTTGGGAHSALLINADERVIFDPAGTWHHPQLPERNDVKPFGPGASGNSDKS